MAVITISREFGSGGNEIAQLVCRELGYQTFDKEMITQAAIEAGIFESGALAFSEGEYRVSSFLDRLLRRQAPAAEVRFWREDPDGVRVVETAQLDETQALQLVQTAVEAAYRHGNFVIVGRGGQAILRGLPGVLHVRVTASLDVRILRVRRRPDFTGSVTLVPGINSTQYDIRLAAQDLIERHDTASQEYLRRNFGINWSDPNLYDVVLNTSHLDIEVAARLVAQAAIEMDAARLG